MKFQILKWAQYLGAGAALRCAAACACLLGVAANPCAAQVIEVHPDGSTATYSGPGITSLSGVTAISRQAALAPRHDGETVKTVIQGAAARHELSPALIEAVAWQESRMRQNAVSPKGARGVMQLMPATAETLHVNADALDGNVEGGTAYLQAMLDRFDGDITLALAAYNAGPQAVQKYGGVPPFAETRAYVSAVLERLAQTSLPANGAIAGTQR